MSSLESLDGLQYCRDGKICLIFGTSSIIDNNSIKIEYIREVASANGEKVILELNGKLKNLSLRERLNYNLIFQDLGKYTKLNIFKDIENIFGEKIGRAHV